MQEWTRLKEYAADRDLGFALVVDAELFRLDSVVRWLDAADGRIKRAAFDPPRARSLRACPSCRRSVRGAAMTALELRAGVQGLRRGPDRGPRPA